ncbi:MAG: hypothetical protein QME78_08385 [Thermodesulfobacteriota bacterium]|nr:hypothetical protein [Thermodesulfobacteriota bacterium]
MYARYQKSRVGNSSIRFRFVEQVSLFGCNEGFIPWLLQLQMSSDRNEPHLWHLDIEKALAKTNEYAGSTLVINLKPKQHKKIFLFMNSWMFGAIPIMAGRLFYCIWPVCSLTPIQALYIKMTLLLMKARLSAQYTKCFILLVLSNMGK